jgi:hypothetical protein
VRFSPETILQAVDLGLQALRLYLQSYISAGSAVEIEWINRHFVNKVEVKVYPFTPRSPLKSTSL